VQALKELREAGSLHPYDVAILDCQMPDIDGLTLAGKIREEPAFANVRLLMLSSAGDRTDLVEHSAILDGWLIKPAKQKKLYETLVALTSALPQVTSIAQNGKSRQRRTGLLAPTRPANADHNLLAGRDKKVRVLVAEDNVVNQKVALLQLQKLGLLADAVGNGREALEALGIIPYPIVLMDCQMPEMDGYATTVEIRKRHPGQRYPIIIAMTAHAMSGDREKCIANGMDDYVGKPVRMEELEEVLARWLPCTVEPKSAAS